MRVRAEDDTVSSLHHLLWARQTCTIVDLGIEKYSSQAATLRMRLERDQLEGYNIDHGS